MLDFELLVLNEKCVYIMVISALSAALVFIL